MKKSLQRLFSPVLNLFESYEGDYDYKPSHRTILIVIGVLFILLSLVSLTAAVYTAQPGAVFPFLIFFAAGGTSLIVGGLGSDRAVARLWGNTR